VRDAYGGSGPQRRPRHRPSERARETADIAFGDGKISEIARDLPASGAQIVDVRGLIVVPGLIDLHTHV